MNTRHSNFYFTSTKIHKEKKMVRNKYFSTVSVPSGLQSTCATPLPNHIARYQVNILDSMHKYDQSWNVLPLMYAVNILYHEENKSFNPPCLDLSDARQPPLCLRKSGDEKGFERHLVHCSWLGPEYRNPFIWGGGGRGHTGKMNSSLWTSKYK